METLGKVFAFVLVTAVGIFSKGYCSMVLWRWFIVPLFDLPALTFGYALGISLVAGMFTGSYSKSENNKTGEKKEYRDILFRQFGYAIAPFFMLLIGWIITLFM